MIRKVRLNFCKCSRLNLIYLILFISLINHNLFAQIAGENDVYTLEQCIKIALERNYDIKLADARFNASSADVKNAFGNFLPNLYANAGYSKQLSGPLPASFVNNQIESHDKSYQLSARGEWVIFDGFSRENNYTRAHENSNSLEYSLYYEKNLTKLRVYQSYTDVIAKYQIVKARKENLELGKKELERIKAQSQAGVIPIDILYSQEADLGNKEYDLVTAENNLNISKANLLSLMGLTPDIQAEFLESSLPSSVEINEISGFRNIIGAYDEAILYSIEHRDDMKSIESSIKASQYSLEGSYSGYYPSVSASGGWSWSNFELGGISDRATSNISLNFSLPIFDQFTTQARIQNSKLQLDQNLIQKSQLEQSIKTSIKTAYLNLDASEKQLDISARALKSAQMNESSLKEKFRVGTSSITDYMTANTQLITAQINRINAVYQYFKAQKEVLYAIGKLN